MNTSLTVDQSPECPLESGTSPETEIWVPSHAKEANLVRLHFFAFSSSSIILADAVFNVTAKAESADADASAPWFLLREYHVWLL